jgi:uridine kinase
VANRDDLRSAVEALRNAGSPVVVAISGYGGSGKSTLVRDLVAEIPDSARLRGDDFLRDDRFDQRSPDWDVVDRTRLRAAIDEHRATAASGSVLFVDAIGILHPDLAGAFDLTVWVDVPLEVATARGAARDRAVGDDHDRLWNEVWTPNERDFDARFAPRAAADVLYEGD